MSMVVLSNRGTYDTRKCSSWCADIHKSKDSEYKHPEIQHSKNPKDPNIKKSKHPKIKKSKNLKIHKDENVKIAKSKNKLQDSVHVNSFGFCFFWIFSFLDFWIFGFLYSLIF